MYNKNDKVVAMLNVRELIDSLDLILESFMTDRMKDIFRIADIIRHITDTLEAIIKPMSLKETNIATSD